jgi:hypothetical protein
LDYRPFGGYINDESGKKANAPKTNGSDFKVIFKTQRIEREDAEIVSCFSDFKELIVDDSGQPILDKDGNVQKIYGGPKIGFKMKAHEAFIYSGGQEAGLHLPYAEEEKIDFSFRIKGLSEDASDDEKSWVAGFEDGVMTSVQVFGKGAEFSQNQHDRQNITFGSEYCDLILYKVRAYERGL